MTRSCERSTTSRLTASSTLSAVVVRGSVPLLVAQPPSPLRRLLVAVCTNSRNKASARGEACARTSQLTKTDPATLTDRLRSMREHRQRRDGRVVTEHRYGMRRCPRCGRYIDLERHGLYRRHFAFDFDGHRRICAASGSEPAGVVRLLTVEPTPDERRSHTLRLLGRLDP